MTWPDPLHRSQRIDRLLLALAACGMAGGTAVACRASPPTPTPRPTIGPVSMRIVPTNPSPVASPWSPPRVPPTSAATPVPAGTTVPTPVVVLAPGGSVGDCPLPRGFETWTLSPSSDAPPDTRAAWASSGPHTTTARVVADEVGNAYALTDENGVGYTLAVVGAGLPLEVDVTYAFTAHVDAAGSAPLGSGLLVEDADGVVFLGLSARETDGALQQLMAGHRGGFAIHQQPTICATGAVLCGFELRSAAVEIGLGDQTLQLRPGENGEIAGFQASIHASHFRRWVSDAACMDPTDYVLSLRLARLP